MNQIKSSIVVASRQSAAFILSIIQLAAVCRHAATLAVFVLFAFSALAQDDPYRAKEFSISSFATVRTGDFETGHTGAGAGLTYFLTRNSGVSVETLTESTTRLWVDSCSVSYIYRAPTGKSAPYFFGGGGRDFERDKWNLHAGLGIEHRFTPHIAVFADARLVKEIDSNRSAEAVGRLGIRIPF